jgi:hypothetical protein
MMNLMRKGILIEIYEFFSWFQCLKFQSGAFVESKN